MPKQYISFLGTNDYLPCNYFFDEEMVKNVKFVQTATVKIFCGDFKEEDMITIFITDESEIVNKSKLVEEFKRFNFKEPEFVKIPSGKEEKELWLLFDIVFNSLKENSSIIFDITHSFRYIPMLSFALLNYSSFVKGTTLEGIYYGALEGLGKIDEVRDMDIEERNVPIFDLTPLITIQKWSIAIENFIQSGNTAKLNEIFESISKNHFTSGASLSTDEQVKSAGPLVKNLQEFLGDITTNRGLKLERAESVRKLQRSIQRFNKTFSTSSPLSPLLKINQKLESLIEPYQLEKTSVKNLLNSVELCIKYGLIQQGYTQLQELIITFLCKKFGFDYLQYKLNRDVMSKLLKVVASKKPESKWEYPLTEIDRNRLKAIVEDETFKKFVSPYSALTDFRNDINHSGFNINPVKTHIRFKNQLNKIYLKVKKIFQEEEI